jgi:hypothetical protein
MDPDGLGEEKDLREITRLNCRQAQRVLVDLNPTPKRAGSEADVARAMASVTNGLRRRVPARGGSGDFREGAGVWVGGRLGLRSPAGPTAESPPP